MAASRISWFSFWQSLEKCLPQSTHCDHVPSVMVTHLRWPRHPPLAVWLQPETIGFGVVKGQVRPHLALAIRLISPSIMLQSFAKPLLEQDTHCDHVLLGCSTHTRDPGQPLLAQPEMKRWSPSEWPCRCRCRCGRPSLARPSPCIADLRCCKALRAQAVPFGARHSSPAASSGGSAGVVNARGAAAAATRAANQRRSTGERMGTQVQVRRH
mmetsp:Transcript_86406/g.239611  ORF Transcript_86406/g.239611 Transcript_86406/m.239611 type:complete len:212 (+) Transcript_86406:285-920(+)